MVNPSSLPSPRARKTLASVLSAALLVSAPGPLAVSALAQAVNFGAVRAAGASGVGAAAAAVGSQSLGGASLAPLAAPGLTSLGAPSAGPAALPAALAPAPAAAPAPAPAAALAAPSVPVPAAAPVAALASGRALGARLDAAAKAESGGPKAAAALNSFFNGETASESCAGGAASCVFAGGSGGNKPSGLSPAGAPRVSPSSRFKIGALQHAAMGTMAVLWKAWDRAIDGKWDKLPPILGELYLYMNEQSLRLRVWDASAQPSVDATSYAPATADQKSRRSADGTYFDDQDPGMAKAGARFNQLAEPAGSPRADFEKMDPSPLVVSEKLQKRDRAADGSPLIHEAGILNDLAAGHIQFNVHDWENHDRQPIAQDPVKFPLPAGHPLAQDGATEMVLDRTAADPTLPADYQGPRVTRNLETAAWDMSNIYGSSLERQLQVRTLKDGKLKFGADGWLQDDPAKPGVPLTGFNENMSPPLIMMHTIWTQEHNAVAEALKAEHPDWNDERLFQMARLRVTALNARLHTTEWTRALLPNRTLQSGMWHDWYGFIGKPLKLWIMRFSDRHPTLARFFAPVRNELMFGIPGTKTKHYGKHYGFVEEFPDVYRLHTMVRDAYLLRHLEAGPDQEVTVRLLKSEALVDTIDFKSRAALSRHAPADWMLTFLVESAGALTINNTPDALRNLTTQDGRKIDLAAVDVIRTRERLEASTYAKFTMRLGEKPPATFLELTGGNQEAADRLAAVYKSVDDVDMQIGILAERKPEGFALGNRQFKVFVLSAPARLKNDRFLSEQYGSATYGASGIEYVEHTNFSNLVERHYPSLRPAVEGVKNAFAPLPAPGSLNDRLLAASQASSDRADSAATWNFFAGFGAKTVAAALGYAAFLPQISLILVPWLASMVSSRLLKKAAAANAAALAALKSGDRDGLLPSVFQAEKDGRRAALAVKVSAFTVLDLGGMVAWHLFALHPVGALLIGAATLYSGLKTLKAARRASEDLTTLRVGLAAKLTEGRPHTDPSTLPGDTALAKRYWVMIGGKETPVAHFSDTFGALRRSGLSPVKAFMTAALWHVPFARRTWKTAPAELKAAVKPGFLDVYIPGLINTRSHSSTRIYSDGSKPGIKRGDLDMAEFDRLFREFGMHDYLTAYDFARIREADQFRDAQEGRGNVLSRLIGRYAAKRRADQLMELFADRVVWEDGIEGKPVPAISRDQLLRFYQGGLQYDVIRDRTEK
jgi:hypothetical protein